jgi:hypothetical protein
MDVEIRPGVFVPFEYVTECEADTEDGDNGGDFVGGGPGV